MSRGAVPEKRRICHSVPDLPASPICTGLCLSLSIRRRVLAICSQSTAVRHLVLLLERLSRQLSGTMFAIASSDTPCTSRRSLTLSHIRRTRYESEGSLRTFSPMAPERSARTSGTIATMLPTDADILRASADDIPNPPAPVDRLACACYWGSNVNQLVGHPSSKNDDSSSCLLYTSPSPRDQRGSRMPSSA